LIGLVINVSNIISPLCYSLIRVEPYTSCSYNCIYCYARWRRESILKVEADFEAVSTFKSMAEKVERLGVKPIPARLSTISDPFQPCEAKYKLSLKVLDLALRYKYPIIVNTKGLLLLRERWLKKLKMLADESLVVVQISLSTLDGEVAKIIEPNAPPPDLRLKAIEELSSKNIPTAIRISPYILGLSLKPNPKVIVKMLSRSGVRRLIVESLRVEASRVKDFYRLVGLRPPDMEAYSFRLDKGTPPIVKPKLEVKLGEYIKLRSLLKDYGITFASCKEGLFSLHTSDDCCGFYMLKEYAKRPTLYEFYLMALKQPLSLKEALEKLHCLPSNYIFNEKLKTYPRILRKPLKSREKRLIRALSNPQILQKLTPELVVEADEKLRAEPLKFPQKL